MTEPGSDFLYSVEREYPVSIERLWHAWIDAPSLEAWYHPTDLVNVPGSVVSDPVVGGWWTVAVDATAYGHIAYFYGRYTRVEPMTMLEHSMSYTQSAEEFAARDESAPSARIVIDFEDRGSSSWARFAHYGELPADQVPLAKAGMGSYFESLAAFLGE